ncbi:hypothetical protein D3C75_489060 [compost metagenome]
MERFFCFNNAEIIKHLVPKTCIEQVKHGMLRSTNIQIYWKPCFLLLRGAQLLIVFRINITQVIPAAARPLRHGVRLAASLHASLRINSFHPLCYIRKWRFPCTRRFDRIYIRQYQRQLINRNSLHCAIFQMQNWNGLSPVALTAKQPVTQTIGYFAFTYALFFQPSNHLRNRFFILESIQEIRIDMRPISGISLFFNVAALNDFHDIQAELFSKFPVASIVTRNCHNCSRSVTSKHIICNPDWRLRTIHRINCICACEDTALLFRQIRTLQIALTRSFFTIFCHSSTLCFSCNHINKLMLWCQYAVTCSEQCIWTCSKHGQVSFVTFNVKVHFCTC